MPDPTVSERRHRALHKLLSLFPVGSCVDLGTGHGSFARQAAKLGWAVTAVDARTERFPTDSRITWIHADVRAFGLTGYDVILCLGLFYHLALEDQLDLLKRASGRPLIIDTHVDHGVHKHGLSEVVTVQGYSGRLYKEPNRVTSSWGNTESFWPTLQSFHEMLAQCGFGTVLTLEPWIVGDRTFFLALPD